MAIFNPTLESDRRHHPGAGRLPRRRPGAQAPGHQSGEQPRDNTTTLPSVPWATRAGALRHRRRVLVPLRASLHDVAGPEQGAVIARHLGPWRLERELGRGGMGAVFVATHTLIGKRAAVKVVLSGPSDPDLPTRFFREAKAAAQLHHPGIVGFDRQSRSFAADQRIEVNPEPQIRDAAPPRQWWKSDAISPSLRSDPGAK